MLVISELLPKVHDLQASLSKGNTTLAIIDFLTSASLSHVLPPAPAFAPRRFVVSDSKNALALYLKSSLVVRCLYHLVNILDMGRDLCSQHDPARHLELDDCEVVLREARSGAAASDNRDRD
jgi:hypothetical protein